MRFVWLIFVGLVLAMLGLLPRLRPGAAPKPAVVAESPAKGPTLPVAAPEGRRHRPIAALVTSSRNAGGLVRGMARRDSIVFFAMQQLGTNYCYAGTTPETGFDCSGFVQYVFARFRVPVPHSTAMLIDVGQPVPREEALPGDIVVFTGTAKTATTPGHAGIIVTTSPEGPMRFIHSSSARRESGVKISQVEGTDYERRFMQVRRVLGPGGPVASRPTRTRVPAPVPLPAPAAQINASAPVATAPKPAKTTRKYPAARKKTAAVAKKKTPRTAASTTRRKAPAKARRSPTPQRPPTSR